MKTRTRALSTSVTLIGVIGKDEAAKTQHREEEGIPVADEKIEGVVA